MAQDEAIIHAKELWNQKKPRDAMMVLIKRVDELSVFPDEQLISQAKRLWNERKAKEAITLLVGRINELNDAADLAQEESFQDEDLAKLSQGHQLQSFQPNSMSRGYSSRLSNSPGEHQSRTASSRDIIEKKNAGLSPFIIAGLGFVILVAVGIFYLAGVGTNPFSSSSSEKSNTVSVIDFQRVEKLVNDYLSKESELFKYGSEGIFSDQFIGYSGLKLGSQWKIGQFSINSLEADRFTVSTHIGYSPVCTEWMSPNGNCIQDLNTALMTVYGFEMPDCTAEWIVILGTQEILPQNECSRRF